MPWTRTQIRAWGAVLLGAIGIGFAPICVRMVEISPVASAFWRLVLATPMLFLLSRRWGRGASEGREHRWRRPGGGIVVLAGVTFAADLGVWHYSIHYTSVANATLLANLAPVFIAAWGLLVWRQRLSGTYWLGLSLALGGAAVLVGASLGRGSQALFGDGLGILAAVFYAAYLLSVTSARREWNTWDLMWMSSAVSALVLLPFAALSATWWPESPGDWLWLLALAGISHVLGQGLIAYGLAHVPATFAAVSLLLQPVAAAAFAWILLAEVIGPIQALGALVVLVGIGLCRAATRFPQRWQPEQK